MLEVAGSVEGCGGGSACWLSGRIEVGQFDMVCSVLELVFIVNRHA